LRLANIQSFQLVRLAPAEVIDMADTGPALEENRRGGDIRADLVIPAGLVKEYVS
jgi:hypothetical protein